MTARDRRPTLIVLLAVVALAASWVGYGRAAAPEGQYSIKNGTVRDVKTNLTWQQVENPTPLALADAVNYCNTLNLDGSGWRIPSMKELQTIVDEAVEAPRIDTKVFPNIVPAPYWTSSIYLGGVDSAWTVDFLTALPIPKNINVDVLNVRCVR